jgi:hypothetical protein
MPVLPHRSESSNDHAVTPCRLRQPGRWLLVAAGACLLLMACPERLDVMSDGKRASGATVTVGKVVGVTPRPDIEGAEVSFEVTDVWNAERASNRGVLPCEFFEDFFRWMEPTESRVGEIEASFHLCIERRRETEPHRPVSSIGSRDPVWALHGFRLTSHRALAMGVPRSICLPEDGRLRLEVASQDRSRSGRCFLPRLYYAHNAILLSTNEAFHRVVRGLPAHRLCRHPRRSTHPSRRNHRYRSRPLSAQGGQGTERGPRQRRGRKPTARIETNPLAPGSPVNGASPLASSLFHR